MTKVDRSWRIGCSNGGEMNEVWQVLKDAGEPMHAGTPHFDGWIGSLVFTGGAWVGVYMDDSANITFEEFMKIMKPENKKEDVQYVDNLLDYVDKPELIQHVDGRAVRAIHCFSNRDMILIVFETGRTTYYYKNGKYIDKDKRSSFILKPKEKKIIKGWTRKVINKDGTIFIAPLAYPTKKEFMDCLKNHYGSDKLGYGPWEEVITEIITNW